MWKMDMYGKGWRQPMVKDSFCNPCGNVVVRDEARAGRVRRAQMVSWRRLEGVLVLLVVVVFGTSVALAQTNLETNAGIQFNLSTPGAANLALGGAFLALADDATAAYTNPAGLTNTLDPEVHIEARSWRYTHLFLDRGRLEGFDPTEIGVDTIAGLRDGKAEDQVTGLSFLSYVYPRKKLVFAFFRHELARFEANFDTQGAFLNRVRSRNILGYPNSNDGRLASLRNSMTLDIVNHGMSIGYRLGAGFSAGLGLSYFDFSLDSIAKRFRSAISSEVTNYADEELSFIQTQIGDDSDWGITAGFIWERANTNWSIGGVYRQGSEFDIVATSDAGPGAVANVDFAESHQVATFRVPDVYGIGISLKPTDALRVIFEYDRIGYSDLARDIADIFDVLSQPERVWGNAPPTPKLNQFRVNDTDEFHFGLEYSFLKVKNPVTVRLGGWYDPDHSLWFAGQDRALEAVFPQRSDEIHYSAGIGILRGSFQLDVAFDYSERVSTGSLSTVFRF